MRLALGILISLVSTTAFASLLPPITAGKPICYGREYSSKHMEAHPKQKAVNVKVKFYKDVLTPSQILMKINVEQKSSAEYIDLENGKTAYVVHTKPYWNIAICDTHGGVFACGVECDGGRVHFGDFSSQVKMTNEGIFLQGGCEEESEDIVYLSPTKGGDDVFNLVQLPEEYCQP